MIDNSYTDMESRGFWEQLQNLRFPKDVNDVLPLAYDRFLEAKHFLTLVLGLEPTEENVQKANWYVGAYLAATISIRDGAREDYRRLAKSGFNNSPLGREFYLSSNAEDPVERDPVGINRAYRELRNLRTHFGVALISVDTRVLKEDIFAAHGSPTSGRPRWFFLPLEGPAVGRLTDPQLSPERRAHFNEYCRSRTLSAIAA
jgi:hypothetical protein